MKETQTVANAGEMQTEAMHSTEMSASLFSRLMDDTYEPTLDNAHSDRKGSCVCNTHQMQRDIKAIQAWKSQNGGRGAPRDGAVSGRSLSLGQKKAQVLRGRGGLLTIIFHQKAAWDNRPLPAAVAQDPGHRRYRALAPGTCDRHAGHSHSSNDHRSHQHDHVAGQPHVAKAESETPTDLSVGG